MLVNEIFYSLQGEGHFSGTPAIFVRFSGCNLRCSFCDTKHEQGTELSAEDIITEINKYPARHVVLTGGEPSLQITEEFVNLLLHRGYFVQIETNGTRPLPKNLSWVTCSPKGAIPVCGRIDELKVVYESAEFNPKIYNTVEAGEYRLQPCDTGYPIQNKQILQRTIEYILANPKWKLSLQTHKILDIR